MSISKLLHILIFTSRQSALHNSVAGCYLNTQHSILYSIYCTYVESWRCFNEKIFLCKQTTIELLHMASVVIEEVSKIQRRIWRLFILISRSQGHCQVSIVVPSLQGGSIIPVQRVRKIPTCLLSAHFKRPANQYMAGGLPETLQLILISPSIKLDLPGHYSRLGDFSNSPTEN